MRSVDDYLAKIPPLYANKPNFTATIAATTASFADLQTFFSTLYDQFDIDEAVGVQLDAVGEWVGQSRDISIPVAQPWFAFDTTNRGWDQGYWQGPNVNGNYIFGLDDDTYRRLLYAKRIANYSDGQTDDAQAALAAYFINPDTNVFVSDVSTPILAMPPFSFDLGAGWDQGYWESNNATGEPQPSLPAADMRWLICVTGAIPTVVDLEILAQNLIPVTPAGVACDVKVVTVNGTPLFGFDVENEFVSGFDVGSWGAAPDFVAQNIV